MKVLNEGYIDLLETWGSDRAIVEAARMSTDKGFLGWGTEEKPGDEKLLAYLWKNRHTTPFEQSGATFEVQAPIFVFREWHRHRTQSYNEFSARYSVMPNIHWYPSVDRIKRSASANKQAQGVVPLVDSEVILNKWIDRGIELQQLVYDHYEQGLSLGIPKEIARFNTPVARYSKMRASANLLNWLRFLGLRNDPHAQEEIRVYAAEMEVLLIEKFPRAIALFKEKKI